MNQFSGMRVTVVGLGRAGAAMARVMAKEGAKVRVVDQKPADSLQMLERMDQVSAQDIDIITSWSGDIDWETTDLIATSPGVPASHPALVEAGQRGVKIWSEVEVGWRIAKAPIIAVTGTNGKSTVAALTYHILKEAGKNAVLCGNIAGTGYSEEAIADAAHMAPEHGVLVAEVSSFQLEFIEGFRPKACTITQISEDHLDRYPSFDEYARAKRRVYENQDETDFAIVNLSRPETYEKVNIRAEKITYDGPNADVMVSEDHLWIVNGDVQVTVGQLWAGGRHNLQNSAAAILLAMTQGVCAEDAAGAVATFKGIRHRMELVAENDGVRFINNSMCTNADALKASLDAVAGPVVLLAGGVAKVQTPGALAGIGEIRTAVLFGRDANYLESELRREGVRTQTTETLEDAFDRANAAAQPGDAVLLSPACASFDQFGDFIERGERFRSLVMDFIGLPE